jgi:hypothetical protein
MESAVPKYPVPHMVHDLSAERTVDRENLLHKAGFVTEDAFLRDKEGQNTQKIEDETSPEIRCTRD